LKNHLNFGEKVIGEKAKMIEWTSSTITQLSFTAFFIIAFLFIFRTLIYFVNGWLRIWLVNKEKSYFLTRLERIRNLNPNQTIAFKEAVEMDQSLASILETALRENGEKVKETKKNGTN